MSRGAHTFKCPSVGPSVRAAMLFSSCIPPGGPANKAPGQKAMAQYKASAL